MFVSWWIVTLFACGLACITAAMFLRGWRKRARVALVGLGSVFLIAWASADIAGGIWPTHDPALEPGGRYIEIRTQAPYQAVDFPCRTEAKMRQSGVYPGASPLRGSLDPVGHMIGWFGGPPVFRESGAPSEAPIYLEVSRDCYLTYTSIGG
jgi:hypothetical protein